MKTQIKLLDVVTLREDLPEKKPVRGQIRLRFTPNRWKSAEQAAVFRWALQSGRAVPAGYVSFKTLI